MKSDSICRKISEWNYKNQREEFIKLVCPWQWSKGTHSIKELFPELSWWLSGKESACPCRRHRFDSRSGKIPHVVEQLNSYTLTIELVVLGLRAATAEPTCCNHWSLHALELVIHNQRNRCNEKPALAITREKSMRHQRLSTAKK